MYELIANRLLLKKPGFKLESPFNLKINGENVTPKWLVFIDTETNGLIEDGNNFPSVHEIGCLIIERANLTITNIVNKNYISIEKKDTTIKSIMKTMLEIHKLTDGGDAVLIAHNGFCFDFPILYAWASFLEGEFKSVMESFQYADTLQEVLIRQIPKPHKNTNLFLRYIDNYKSEIILFDDAHSALPDSIMLSLWSCILNCKYQTHSIFDIMQAHQVLKFTEIDTDELFE